MRESQPITPTEDPNTYRLKTHVPQDSINGLEVMAKIEGFSRRSALYKMLVVYDFLHENTVGIGTNIYSSTSLSHLGAEKLPTPHSYLRSRAVSMSGEYSVVDFPISAATNEIIRRHMIEDRVDFHRLFVGAVGYYGMIASHLYAERNILVKTLFKRAEPMRITQMDVPAGLRASE